MRAGVSISTILAFSYAQDSFIEGQPGPGKCLEFLEKKSEKFRV